MAWPGDARWKDEPRACRCTVRVVADLADTLHCPRGWRWVARISRWVHA
jgi:hypothetical protein